MTPIPNIPTDNLYKFIFLSGVLLIILSSTIWITQYSSILDNMFSLNIEVTKANSESSFIDRDINSLNEKIKNLEKERKSGDSAGYAATMSDEKYLSTLLNDKNYREYMAFVLIIKKIYSPTFERQYRFRN